MTKLTLSQSVLLPVLLQDVIVEGGRVWMRASALARHLGQPIDQVRRQIDLLRPRMSGRWWLRNVRPEGLDVRLTRDGIAVLPLELEGVPGLRLKALCLEAFEEAERLRLHLSERQPGLGQPLEQPDEEPAPAGWATPGAAPATERSGTAPVSQASPGRPLPVPFQGATLYVVEHAGEPYVPMRPIVEGMGLDWKSQYIKLLDRFRSCVVQITTQLPGDTQKREVVCMLLRKLPGWLYSVNPDKVRPDLREKILAYQNECDDVLWRYWTEGRVERPGRADTAAEPRRLAPRAGPFVLDDAFVARVYVALGRKAVQTEVLRRLLLCGALEKYVSMTVRQIAADGRRLSSSGVHRALQYLCQKGIVVRSVASPGYRVMEAAVRSLLNATDGLALAHIENVLAGALEAEIADKRRKLH